MPVVVVDGLAIVTTGEIKIAHENVARIVRVPLTSVGWSTIPAPQIARVVVPIA